MEKIVRQSTWLFLSCVLCACAPFKADDHRASVCNELNSQLIFNGSTSDLRKANIESAQAPLMQRQNDKNCTPH